MNWKNCELRYIDHAGLADKGVIVPATQPYRFNEETYPKINDEMRNGLAAKSERGSPVFTVKAIYEEKRDGESVSVAELEFNRIEPTPYSKVPENE